MFSQIYFHKTRRAYDHHVSCAVKEILSKDYPELQGCYPTPEHLDIYTQFDDWKMCGKIIEGKGGKHGNIILNRQHYRKKFETDLLPSKEQEEKLDELVEELKKEGKNDYFIDKASTKWYKMDKDILICDEADGYVRELSGLSPIIKNMVDTPRKKRLYVEIERG